MGEGGRRREGERERSWDVITAKCAGLRGYADADRAAPPTQRPVTPRHSSRALCQIAGAALPSAPVLRRAGERPPPRTLIIVKAGSRNAKISPHPQIDNAAPRRAAAVFYALSVRQLRPRSRLSRVAPGGRRAYRLLPLRNSVPPRAHLMT